MEYETVDREGNCIYENDETITEHKIRRRPEEPAAAEEYEQVNPCPTCVELDNLE